MIRHRSRGFTLIEVMIVVAIIGILAAVAYPSYKDSILKGRRAAGRAALVELLQQQERYLTQRGAYLVFSNAAGSTTPSSASTTFKVYSGDNPTKPDYWLNAVTNAGACAGFTARDCIVVTAVPTQPDPQAGDLSISSTGVKDCSGSFKSSNFKGCWP